MGSSLRRTSSPQDNEPVSALWCGEPAIPRRSLGGSTRPATPTWMRWSWPGPRRGWGRDARTAEQSEQRGLAGCARRRGVRARIVPQRPGFGRREEGVAKPVRGKAGQEGGCMMSVPGQSSTGSAEEAMRGAETPASRNWSWVEAGVWTERMLSALGNGVKGGKWYSLIDKVYAPETLRLAWTKVEANAGAAGVDGQSVERFAAKAEVYLSELATAVREDDYRAHAVKRVEIAKGDGRMRPLGIPTVKDRIVQQAVRLVIEPILPEWFCDGSYGFRPEVRVSRCAARGRSAAQSRLHPRGACRLASRTPIRSRTSA